MTAKEFLKSYGAAMDKIRLNKELMLHSEQAAAELGRGSADRYVSEYQDRLYEENEELYRQLFAVELAMRNSPFSETERAVLTRRYILREKWEQISEEMAYSTQHLHRIERSAAKKLVTAQPLTAEYVPAD